MSDIVSVINKRIVMPLTYRKRGLKVKAWFNQLRYCESMSPEELIEYQAIQLAGRLQYCHTYVPYYKRIISDAGISLKSSSIFSEILKLPILTKAEVRTNLDSMLSTDSSITGKKKNMTGGSTGTPLEFYQDNRYWSSALASEAAILNWWSVEPGDKTTSFWGSDRELHKLSISERFRMWLSRENIFDSFSMSDESMAKFAKVIERWNPVYIKGYASSLHLFAKYILSNRSICIRPKAIRSTAETLFQHQRVDIEKAFNCKVYNFYGSREVNNLAAECPMQNGLHIMSPTRFVEVVDVNGSPVAAGEIGRIVVTDLVNNAMPFVRYENGDLGVMTKDLCKCGRPYPLLEKILGRISDILVGTNGKFVHGEYITHLFYGMHDVRQFKLIQKSLNEIHLLIVPDKPTGTIRGIDAVCDAIKNKLGGNIEIDVHYVTDFERSSSGKHQFVCSDISPFKNCGES